MASRCACSRRRLAPRASAARPSIEPRRARPRTGAVAAPGREALRQRQADQGAQDAEARGAHEPFRSHAPRVGDDTQAQPEAGSYAWTKQWYPVCVVAHTDPKKPHHIQVLGKDLVFWCDGQKQWRAFEDKCPHRLAPLSEGRVEEDGTLLCAYHGWRFDGDGQCTAMPQVMGDANEEARMCKSARACARAYPTAEHHGLLWVWAESGADAFLESMTLNPPRLSEEYLELERARGGDSDGASGSGRGGGGDTEYKVNEWMQRDLPYGWDSFFENAIDPAHACVSHHGLVGSRYTDAIPFQWASRRGASAMDGFRMALDPAPPPFNVVGNYQATCEYDFQPPVHLRFDWEHPRGYGLAILHYCTPTSPGRCRHFQATVCTKDAGGSFDEQPRWFRLNKLSFQPSWWSHIVSPTFLHQDLVLLHSQEKIVEQEDETWFGACHMPTPSDKSVIMFRRWLQRAGGLGWQLPPAARRLPPIERDPTKLFDTWNAHTKNCVPCQRALMVTQGVMLASGVGAAAAISGGDLGTGLALGANLAGFNILRDLFYKYEFSHQDNGDDLWNIFARDILLKPAEDADMKR